jgi:hypothetical protein
VQQQKERLDNVTASASALVAVFLLRRRYGMESVPSHARGETVLNISARPNFARVILKTSILSDAPFARSEVGRLAATRLAALWGTLQETLNPPVEKTGATALRCSLSI